MEKEIGSTHAILFGFFFLSDIFGKTEFLTSKKKNVGLGVGGREKET